MKKLLLILSIIVLTSHVKGQQNDYSIRPGYKGLLSAGYGIDVDYPSSAVYQFDFINGKQFDDVSFLGLGIGLRYDYDDRKSYRVPLYLQFKANLTRRKLSPYLALKLGYAFVAQEKIEGEGLLLDPEIGLNYYLSDHTWLIFGINYEIQRYTGQFGKGAYHYFGFKIGLMFG